MTSAEWVGVNGWRRAGVLMGADAESSTNRVRRGRDVRKAISVDAIRFPRLLLRDFIHFPGDQFPGERRPGSRVAAVIGLDRPAGIRKTLPQRRLQTRLARHGAHGDAGALFLLR